MRDVEEFIPMDGGRRLRVAVMQGDQHGGLPGVEINVENGSAASTETAVPTPADWAEHRENVIETLDRLLTA